MKKIILIFALPPALLFAQTTGDSLTSELSKLTGDSAIIGFAVAILNQDSIIYANGFGFSDVENQIPYTINTVQPIASISKTLIGISLMKAREMNMLDLDDNINLYLPFEIINPYYPDSVITIRHLANHRSSLRDTKHYEKSYVFDSPIPMLQKDWPFFPLKNMYYKFIVRRTIREYNSNEEIPLTDFLRNIYVPGEKWYSKKSFGKYPPGAQYSYSNNGAAIASLIIEKVSGMKYTEFVERYILKPLGMQYSGWDQKNYTAHEKTKLYPYSFYVAIPEYKLITIADGGFITNVIDFSKYLSAVIRGYNGENNIINSSSYNKMVKENTIHDQGIFWCIKELDNDNYIGHTGGDPGVNTIALFDKQTNMGYICFSNTNTYSGEELDKAFQYLVKYSKRLINSNSGTSPNE